MQRGEFSLIAAQDALVRELVAIEYCGCGEHRVRSRIAAIQKLRRTLLRLGYSTKSTEAILKDAADMAKLELACEE